MQDKNNIDVKKILLNIAKHVNCKRIIDFAAYLETPKSNLYAWIARGKIADVSCILKKMPNVRIEYLETGEGKMFNESTFVVNEDHEQYPAIPSEEVIEIMTRYNNSPEFRLGVMDLLKRNDDELLDYIKGGRQTTRRGKKSPPE